MTFPTLTPQELEKLEANLEAARRAISRFVAGESHDERCAFCNQPIEIRPIPKDPPYTSFNTSCPCGKAVGQIKGL